MSRLGLPFGGLLLYVVALISRTAHRFRYRPPFLGQLAILNRPRLIVSAHLHGVGFPTRLVTRNYSESPQQYGEGPERAAWFPMVINLDVLEEGTGDDGGDVTSRYEVS